MCIVVVQGRCIAGALEGRLTCDLSSGSLQSEGGQTDGAGALTLWHTCRDTWRKRMAVGPPAVGVMFVLCLTAPRIRATTYEDCAGIDLN